jgi:hypothetical protein
MLLDKQERIYSCLVNVKIGGAGTILPAGSRCQSNRRHQTENHFNHTFWNFLVQPCCLDVEAAGDFPTLDGVEALTEFQNDSSAMGHANSGLWVS